MIREFSSRWLIFFSHSARALSMLTTSSGSTASMRPVIVPRIACSASSGVSAPTAYPILSVSARAILRRCAVSRSSARVAGTVAGVITAVRFWARFCAPGVCSSRVTPVLVTRLPSAWSRVATSHTSPSAGSLKSWGAARSSHSSSRLRFDGARIALHASTSSWCVSNCGVVNF